MVVWGKTDLEIVRPAVNTQRRHLHNLRIFDVRTQEDAQTQK
jgi:hypothetical protein